MEIKTVLRFNSIQIFGCLFSCFLVVVVVVALFYFALLGDRVSPCRSGCRGTHLIVWQKWCIRMCQKGSEDWGKKYTRDKREIQKSIQWILYPLKFISHNLYIPQAKGRAKAFHIMTQKTSKCSYFLNSQSTSNQALNQISSCLAIRIKNRFELSDLKSRWK